MKRPDYSPYFFVIIAWLMLLALNQCESSNNIERELRYIKWEIERLNNK